MNTNMEKPNEPITIEFALSMLEKSLKKGDRKEIEKWDFVIRSENDYRCGI